MADAVAPVLRPVYEELSSIVSALKNLSTQDNCDEDMVYSARPNLDHTQIPREVLTDPPP